MAYILIFVVVVVVVVVVALFGYKFASSSEYFELFIQSGSSILFHKQYIYV